MTLYDKQSKKDALNSMAISDYGTYIMYFNDEDGTFNVGLYSTGTVEADEFYEHNHEVARSTSPSDLSLWLGCFECDECPNTQEDMEKCFTEQISEQIDYDVIREAVTEVCQRKLQGDMDLVLEIIGTIYEKYYSTGEFMQWCSSQSNYYESTTWDYIVEGLENSDYEYNGSESFDRTVFNNDVEYICESLVVGIDGLDEFKKLMREYRFEDALKELEK